ncbi:MAG: TonB C-terminal domain-containing protein [Burkholderiales bacterium]|jgi:colicin import membrane protein|nr:TonB C-terminal domain-containing protein [Burkholderiales bacterium]
MIMPRQSPSSDAPKRRADFWIALTFAVVANLIFLGLLVVSVSWRNPPPVPVTAELYAPPAPEPKPLPPPPKPPVKPPPEIKPPEQPDPEIAIRKKKEEERRKQEAEEKARQEKERIERQRAERERAERERIEKARVERERREREESERREAEQKEREEAAQREAELQRMLNEQARLNERQAAEDRWVQSIRIKVKGNLVLPPNIAGNPEAVFLIVQLPTGEVIDAKLHKNSGNAAYDDAVYRAIMKSSPLPKPERADLFRRELRFVFRPRD